MRTEFEKTAQELVLMIYRNNNISNSEFEEVECLVDKMVDAHKKSILENERLMDMIIDLEDWTKNGVTKTEDSK